MLYYDFKNYEDFKEIFGIVEHGNGVKSRKNKILLAAYKDKKLFRRHVYARYARSILELGRHFADRYYEIDAESENSRRKHIRKARAIARNYESLRCDIHASFLNSTDIVAAFNAAQAKGIVYGILQSKSLKKEFAFYNLHLMGREFFSDKYETDDMAGLCEDGTLNAIRYRSIEKGRVFKMRAGKMFSNIWENNILTRDMPEQIIRWMGEEFVADWTEYSRERLSDERYTLHVDDDFKAIYDTGRCKGYDDDSDSFGSCMVDDDQWTFYRDSVKAKAAYLTDEDDMIVARCILFTEVKDHEGGVWRLAERQYAAFCDDTLKRQLVTALIRGGFIDGYKRVGSSCHDGRDFLDNEGNSLADKMFSIECTLGYGDTLSYQDSFKWLDMDDHVATNYGAGSIDLATTSRYIEEPDDNEDEHEGEVWSDWEQSYIPEDDSCWVSTRDSYFYNDDVVYAKVWDEFNNCFYEEDCYVNDCIEIDGDFYYAGHNAEEPSCWGLICCEWCEEYMPKKNAVHSELTDGWYCSFDCCEEAEKEYREDHGHVWSEWDEAWYEDPDDVITVKEWLNSWCSRPGHYNELTISVETFNDLVEKGKATEFCGQYYVDDIMSDGEPAHIGQDRKVA